MIREYNENDFNLVNVLGREISNDYILKISPVGVCYVYELEDEIVGFILADVFDDRSEIIDVSVALLYRNKKIGDLLVKKIIDISSSKGCDNITLEVKTNNEPAIKLYKNNGFKIISVRKKYYSNGTIDAYLMQRKLWFYERCLYIRNWIFMWWDEC